jgi:hypothetical protein
MVGGTDHGTLENNFRFADDRKAHGRVPTPASTLPMRTARIMTGKRRQSENRIAKSSLFSLSPTVQLTQSKSVGKVGSA